MPKTKLDFRGGGWVLLLSGLVMLAFLIQSIYLLGKHTSPYNSAPASTADYGFDLSASLVPADQIVPAAAPQAILPLNDPSMIPADEVPALNKQYRKYLVPGDRVIGVSINGHSRAYPLRVLAWHEVCNDTLDGTPIVITYSPLCDSAAVFDRRIDNKPLRFAPSGLLYNSNLLMYDDQPLRTKQSLWSQLQFRAITGPAAGNALTLLPMQVVYWQDWLQQHPDTLVLLPQPENIARYRNDPYTSYYGTQTLRYPVALLPDPASAPLMTTVVVIDADTNPVLVSLSQIADKATAQDPWQTDVNGRTLKFDFRQVGPNPATVWVTAETGEAVLQVQTFWFAWFAMHPSQGLSDQK